MKENSKGIIKKNSDGTYKITDLNGNDYKVHFKIGETECENEFQKKLSWGNIQDIIAMYHIELVNYNEIKEENKYVPNDVFKFRICLNPKFTDDQITLYTKPFPDFPPNEYETFKEAKEFYDNQEDLVQEKYFTQQKIDELKLKFIQRIQESKNPFIICCVDRDGGYNVTEKQLFKLE